MFIYYVNKYNPIGTERKAPAAIVGKIILFLTSVTLSKYSQRCIWKFGHLGPQKCTILYSKRE